MEKVQKCSLVKLYYSDVGVLPIEVKSGKDYYIHSAINNVLKTEDFGINKAVELLSSTPSEPSGLR